MQNEAGESIDIYIPRKCSWTNRILAAKDHASVQINVARVNANGVFTGESDTFALAGYIRSKGEADLALTELARQADAKN
uniref:40S ribosomal protein S21 n=1 Tax=Globisporangium ultimum (strain ATCC 200006 / CBS 805.95 / DAOM BR144) TaxID=431595 RepID=K3WSU9_GLOUD